MFQIPEFFLRKPFGKEGSSAQELRKSGVCDGTGPHGPRGRGGRGQGRGPCDGTGPHGPRGGRRRFFGLD
jgi:hypothetical protein